MRALCALHTCTLSVVGVCHRCISVSKNILPELSLATPAFQRQLCHRDSPPLPCLLSLSLPPALCQLQLSCLPCLQKSLPLLLNRAPAFPLPPQPPCSELPPLCLLTSHSYLIPLIHYTEALEAGTLEIPPPPFRHICSVRSLVTSGTYLFRWHLLTLIAAAGHLSGI